MAYLRWKQTLEMEVQDLGLSPAEWLELISIRTKGTARMIVNSAKDMGLVDPQLALEFIWQEFDERFAKQPELARQILQKLKTFPEISTKDSKNL